MLNVGVWMLVMLSSEYKPLSEEGWRSGAEGASGVADMIWTFSGAESSEETPPGATRRVVKAWMPSGSVAAPSRVRRVEVPVAFALATRRPSA